MKIVTIVARTSPNNLDSVLSHIGNNGGTMTDVKQTVQMLLQFQLVFQVTGFLIDKLKNDRFEDSVRNFSHT